jgi:hypothetical protein
MKWQNGRGADQLYVGLLFRNLPGQTEENNEIILVQTAGLGAAINQWYLE